MTPEEAVIARLSSISAVTALVSTRIRQLMFAQSETWPAVRVQLIGEVEYYTLEGSNGVLRARVQVDSVAQVGSGTDPYAAALALAAAINGDGNGASATGLSGWRGSLGSPPVDVKGMFRVDRGVEYEHGAERLVRVRQDYHVWVKN